MSESETKSESETETAQEAAPRHVKRMKRIILLDYVRVRTTDLQGSLDGAINALQRIRDKIPEAYRESARIDFDFEAEAEAESESVRINVFYHRPETEDEVARRIERARLNAEAAEALDRQTLASLIKRYGVPKEDGK